MPSHPDGRPMTNGEMWDFLQAAAEARDKRIARFGCCEEEFEPHLGGRCFAAHRVCPRWKANQEAYGFVTRLLDFLNGTSQQAFADECAARFVDDNP